MQAEEIRKRKESEKMVRRGDDEPDWQNVSWLFVKEINMCGI